ncbi:GH32 C-terminal domain-containing protein [Corynebacterium pelargi]|uniref:beta-fructofuranosidase n=1 Tax=Corynebacterium pelargi TaxID=1471400 RepID=A0A410W9L6_9CORY|nr:GH32 C-terminal domain-containing protein [Corynebacterium pelargi]QAU52653.1 Sucrose-6-phosphate hydrolase [Corynebacterium pelargi]GGG77922.1 beta-fructosidase [Corynebacterium pelargi]
MAHRPELHVTPEIGILDAPAGALFDGTHWHIFAQFRPTADAGARWSHQIAEGSPLNWEICDDVLAPEGEEIKVRAGSVVQTGDETLLYYTSVSPDGDEVHLASIDDLAASTEFVSDEGSSLDQNVRHRGVVLDDRDGFYNFRSPSVRAAFLEGEEQSGWLMLAVSGSMDEPQLVLLDSQDGVDWKVRGPLSLEGDTGLEGERLVAPRLIRLKDQVDGQLYDVLILTIERQGIDISGYLVGKLEHTTFQAFSPFQRIDFGHDFTRPRITSVPSAVGERMGERYNSTTLFGFMNGRGRNDTPKQHRTFSEEGWANCLALPRAATLQHRRLYQTPPAGLWEAVELSDRAALWTAVLDVPQGESVSVELVDSQGDVAAVITHRGERLTLDRSMNKVHQGDAVAEAELHEDDTDAITIVVDGPTVEVFADGGQVAMASRVFFEGVCSQFRVHSTERAEVQRTHELRPKFA